MRGYQKYFTDAVRETYPENADFLLNEIAKNFRIISIDTAFALKSANPIDRRLDFCAYFLALIKTLDAQNESYESIRRICLEIVTEYVRPKTKLESFLRKLPAKLICTRPVVFLVKKFGRRVEKKASPSGFRANIITDKDETLGFGYGVDIMECGICKLFEKHGYHKYAAILCEVDRHTSQLAGLQLIRSGTIATGADKCDFRYKKLSS